MNSNPYSSLHTASGQAGNQYEIPAEPTSHFRLKNEHTKSIIVNSVLTKIPPKQQGTFTSASILRFELPSSGWLDCENIGFTFNLNVYTELAQIPGNLLTTGNTLRLKTDMKQYHWVCLKNGVQAIINRIKVMYGTSTPAEDIQDYHVLLDMLRETSAPVAYIETTGFFLEGMVTGHSWGPRLTQWRQISAQDYLGGGAGSPVSSVLPKEYFLRPMLGVFNMGKHIPAGYTGQMNLEIYLNRPEIVFMQPIGNLTGAGTSTTGSGTNPFTANVSAAAAYASIDNAMATGNLVPATATTYFKNTDAVYPNLSYSIDNCFMFCNFVFPLDEYNRTVKAKMEAGSPIDLFFTTFRQHQRQIANTWQGSNSVVLNERVASLKSILACFIVEGDHTSWFYPRRYQHVGITSYQWKIAEVYYPSQPVNCDQGGVEAYIEVLKTMGQNGDVNCSNNIGPLEYRPADSTVVYSQPECRKKLSSQFHTYNNKFFLFGNFESSTGQLSGVDLLRMNTDPQLNYTLTPKFQNTIDPLFRAAPWCWRAEVSCMPTLFVAAGANGVNVFAGNPLYIDNVAMKIDGAGQNDAQFQANAFGYADTVANRSQETVKVTQYLAMLHSNPYLLTPSESVGPWPVYGWLTLPIANTNATTGATGGQEKISFPAATTAFITTFDHAFYNSICGGPLPTYYTFMAFTHYESAMRIATFGTVNFTTDIYNL